MSDRGDDLSFVLILETILFSGVEVAVRKSRSGKERFIWTLPAPDFDTYHSNFLNNIPDEVLVFCFGEVEEVEDKSDFLEGLNDTFGDGLFKDEEENQEGDKDDNE